jgi:hypothetical protein
MPRCLLQVADSLGPNASQFQDPMDQRGTIDMATISSQFFLYFLNGPFSIDCSGFSTLLQLHPIGLLLGAGIGGQCNYLVKNGGKVAITTK